MLTPILTAIASFLLTGLIGNWLLQRWQQNNWLHQQRVQAAIKEYDELRKVIDELMALSSARLYRTRRLTLNLRTASQDKLQEIFEDYAKSVTAWNDKFQSVCVGIRVFVNYNFSIRVENEIQTQFVNISQHLDALVAKAKTNQIASPTSVGKLNAEMNSLSGRLEETSTELIKLLHEKQRYAYEGQRIPFTKENLHLFSRWYLFKALFKSIKSPQPVSRPLTNSLPPIFLWPKWSRKD